MNDTMKIVVGLLIPLAGTVLGAAMVFFLKGEMKPKLQKALLGFASGVMIAASVWSLLIPSIDMAEANGGIPWIPATIGFLIGIGFLLLLDTLCCMDAAMISQKHLPQKRLSLADPRYTSLFQVTLLRMAFSQ